ncbi:MAG: hypothetical protein KC731_15745, partial [Myxococcales bacterium]|nr:hypothetical protein [Myxococcales bacterium]
ATRAVERLALEFARDLLEVVDGSVSLEVDGRLAFKRRAIIERARVMLDQLAEAGIDRERILLKIPATWEGIEAARKLKDKNGARCHMTLVFGLHQLAACADAGASVIAPAVGRITDFHKKQDGVEGYAPDADPGVLAVRRMLAYLAAHHPETRLMASTFRSPEQASALADCPLLCLPPKIIEELQASEAPVLDLPPVDVPERLSIDQAAFQKLHAADALAQSKLASAVQNLSWAYVSQEKQLVEWIAKRQDEAAESSTLALFRIWDYDGDGFIDREEWNGTEEVFNALDRDNNGRISLEEMAAGLGAPYRPEE